MLGRVLGAVLLAMLVAGGVANVALQGGVPGGLSDGTVRTGAPCSVSALEGTTVALNASCTLGPPSQGAVHHWDINADGTWDTQWLDSQEYSHVWGDDYSGSVRVQRGMSEDKVDIALEAPAASWGGLGDDLWSVQAFVPVRPLLSKVAADISINWGEPADLHAWIRDTLDPAGMNLSHGSVPYTEVPVGRFIDPRDWPVIDMDPVMLDTNRTYYVVFNGISRGPGSYEIHVSDAIRPDWPAYTWDAMGWHEIPGANLRFRTYTREVTPVAEGAIDVTIENVPPSVSLDHEAGGEAELVLRVAGEKFHDVTATLERDGVPVANATSIRVPGNPDEQAVTLGPIPASPDRYSVTVTYTPLDDPENGRVWGATPAWLALRQPGGDVVFHHTFNARHEDTWTWRVDNLGSFVRASGIGFTAILTDPGSDDLRVTWDFGDGATLVQTFLNDPLVGPDPYPSPDVHPRAITATVDHAYAASGTYTVSVTVEDDDGGVTARSMLVTI